MVKVKHGNNVHIVPCGKCAFCLTSKRSSWMFRIHHEMRLQEHRGYFLTFTYDQKHVKRGPEGFSLRFKDIQLYLKRLRKAKYYAKYVCVGEYGSKTHRPHYHMLLWTDAPVTFLESNWKSSTTGKPMGHIRFGTLTMESAMYTLKYIIQPKQKAVDGFERTRAQFSKGLGLGYLTSAVYDFHTEDYDAPKLFSYIDGRKVALPRYYRNKIFTKYQLRVEAERIKFERYWKERKELRGILRQGLARTRKFAKVYRQSIRIEQARRIIEKTKFTEVL